MGFIATDSGGGNFKRVPQGVHIGRCYSLIDLGTQVSDGQYGLKEQHKIRIGWELFAIAAVVGAAALLLGVLW